MDRLTYVGLGGDLTYKEEANGDLYVFGTVTDSSIDRDKQLMDPEWLKGAMTDWFATGANFREQHNGHIAAGVGVELIQDGEKWQTKSLVVDPGTKEKIKKGVLKSQSIGILGAMLIADKAAEKGRFVGGEVVEVSYVDRGSNYSADLAIVKGIIDKAVAGDEDWVLTKADGSMTIQSRAEGFPCPECNGLGTIRGDEDAQVECPRCKGSGNLNNDFTRPSDAYAGPAGSPLKAAESHCLVCKGTGMSNADHHVCSTCLGSGKAVDPDCVADTDAFGWSDVEKSVWTPYQKQLMPDSVKKDYSDSERKTMSGNGQAMSGGGFPIKTVGDLKNAIQAIGRAKDRSATIAHIKTRAKALGQEALIPSEWGKSAVLDVAKSLQGLIEKAGNADTFTHDPADIKEVTDGISSLLIAEIQEQMSGEDERYDIEQLSDALSTVLSWQMGEFYEGETSSPFNQGDSMFVGLNIDPEIVKGVSCDEPTTEAKTEYRVAVVKALGLDEDIKEAVEKGVQEGLSQFDERLKTVEKMAAPVAVAKRAVSREVTVRSEIEELVAKAAAYQSDAYALTNDPAARAEGLEKAQTFLAQAQARRDQLDLGD